MSEKKIDNINTKHEDIDDTSSKKKSFVEPKLTFVEPELTKHGDATRITKQDHGFFGTFIPS